MPIEPPNVYLYLAYRKYLKDWFHAKKRANPRFSHRAFAAGPGSSPRACLFPLSNIQGESP